MLAQASVLRAEGAALLLGRGEGEGGGRSVTGLPLLSAPSLIPFGAPPFLIAAPGSWCPQMYGAGIPYLSVEASTFHTNMLCDYEELNKELGMGGGLHADLPSFSSLVWPFWMVRRWAVPNFACAYFF